MINQIHTGDILLSKYISEPDLSFDIISFLINTMVDGDYLHSGIVYNNGRWLGNNMVLIGEALYEGFVLRYYDDTILEENIKVGDIDIYRHDDTLGTQDKVQMHSSMQHMMGREYSIQDLLKIFVHKLFGWNVFSDTLERVTCAEVVARVYDELGMKVTDEVDDLDLVTPSMLGQSKYLHEVEYNEG